MSLASVFGCVPHRPEVVTVELPISVVTSLSKDLQCIYYKDLDDGDVYRVSLDGTVRERVIRAGMGRAIRLDATRPGANAQGRIHLSCVPGGSGFTVLDVVGARPTLPDFHVFVKSVGAHIVNTDIRTGWRIDFVTDGAALEPGHIHEYWDKVVFAKGTTTMVYDFQNRDEARTGVWVVDEAHAVLFDHPNVIVWNLLTNERRCIAHSDQIVVWPRNLHQSERFVPLAKYKRRTWKLKSPDDVDVRPDNG